MSGYEARLDEYWVVGVSVDDVVGLGLGAIW